MIKSINRVLIANRGEIACRIIRTLNKMGIESVAVYSDADRHALHVEMATHAVHVGASPAIESYLKVETIIAAAKATGADAIHPGYGFLSENPLFAEACVQAGIIFIGPPPAAIRDMGSKSAAKRIMEKSGVPLIPGYHGDDQRDEILRHESTKIGFPVILKAALGGGGKGMRTVYKLEEFDHALASCRREALSAFNDDTILIEKYIEQPRHVEIQVFFDKHGNGIHLFDRDCSIQRRHQKIIEEAPAPNIPDEIRYKMAQDAVLAARAIHYVGAGTVEFLYDGNGQYYFMEMNTRLQVEHPVTEMVTGLDLVQLQVDIASGKPLAVAQSDIHCTGQSLEARLCAEDCNNGFMPSTGPIHFAECPDLDATIRLDSGMKQSDEISVFYDPMFAKLIVWGRDRSEAVRKMRLALSQLRITGVETNIAYLNGIFCSTAFDTADLSTHFLASHQHTKADDSELHHSAVAAAIYMTLSKRDAEDADTRALPFGWRLNSNHTQRFDLDVNGSSLALAVRRSGDGFSVDVDEVNYRCTARFIDGALVLSGDPSGKWSVHGQNNAFFLFEGANRYTVKVIEHDAAEFEHSGNKKHAAPMPGLVTKLYVNAGDAVQPGDPLVAIEAMKMEHIIYANCAGTVDAVLHQVGDSVQAGVEVVRI